MKKVSTILASALTYLSFTLPVYAAQNVCPKGNIVGLCIGQGEIGNVIGRVITFVFILAGILALFYLIWGGIKWLISGGDKTALEEARNHIIAAIIGLAIIFLSYFILNIVLAFFLPGFNLSNFELPNITAP